MRLELFDYPLPPERIAQTPIHPRDASRLLVLRADGSWEHKRFRNFPDLLTPDDLLVFNDTRVIPARVYGRKESGGRVELLLLQRLAAGRWEALAYPGRRLQPGTRLLFGDGELRGEILERGAEGSRVVLFDAEGGPEEADILLHRLGEMPLPPYIHERLDDQERYQTMYAREEGSAAAPTAGLHFTPDTFQALQERGVKCAYVTLHVGIATFRPVKTETIEDHEMHPEWYTVPEATAEAIANCKGRVVAVGTTTMRCLESAAARIVEADKTSGSALDAPERPPSHTHTPTHPHIPAGSAVTRLYLTPGSQFHVVDALLTNFHMPRSSLLILVSAFAGAEAIRAAYEDAIQHEYRFLSFGDAMFMERAAHP